MTTVEQLEMPPIESLERLRHRQINHQRSGQHQAQELPSIHPLVDHERTAKKLPLISFQGKEEDAMTKSEQNRFRAILTAKVAELKRLTRQRYGISIERSLDLLDEIQAASERALAASNLDCEYNQLQNARAALDRIQEGSFGTCQRCDEQIHPKRLAEVPWTQFCIRCQEAVDRNPEEMETPTRDLLRRAA